MKTIILSISIALLSTALFAQSEIFAAAMQKNIAAIDTSFHNPVSLLDLANNFE